MRESESGDMKNINWKALAQALSDVIRSENTWLLQHPSEASAREVEEIINARRRDLAFVECTTCVQAAEDEDKVAQRRFIHLAAEWGVSVIRRAKHCTGV